MPSGWYWSTGQWSVTGFVLSVCIRVASVAKEVLGFVGSDLAVLHARLAYQTAERLLSEVPASVSNAVPPGKLSK